MHPSFAHGYWQPRIVPSKDCLGFGWWFDGNDWLVVWVDGRDGGPVLLYTVAVPSKLSMTNSSILTSGLKLNLFPHS